MAKTLDEQGYDAARKELDDIAADQLKAAKEAATSTFKQLI